MTSGLSPPPPGIDAFSLCSDALLLDVDGTILDIAATPEAVCVPQSLKHTLSRLQAETGGATALVSGRTILALDLLFAPLALAAVGCHGAEWRIEPGRPAEFRAEPLPLQAKQDLLSAIPTAPQIRIEDKRYTLAIHYHAAPELGPLIEAQLVRALEPYTADLRLLHGKLVFEVKPRGFDKGEVTRALMLRPPFAGRRPVFLGDDTTDQDAFAAVRELGGAGISVGRPMVDAEYMLPDPQAARDWLRAIASSGLHNSH